MKLQTSILLNSPIEMVWAKIIDIENCADTISGIIKVEVLEKPQSGLIGFKWSETRVMFGKQADETMWITHSEDNHYYQTRAENGGAIYISIMRVVQKGDQVELSMEFKAETTTLFAKIMSFIFTPLMKKSMLKMIHKDLEDIKASLEKHP
ncbi:MAG: SRPBCC family protein [Saccharospirillaceae bacterium]|nr:SRPBCC family protein [Saccharospirillaceae bacterium]